eukprot:9180216-Pyramimonas_sp.AAC.1
MAASGKECCPPVGLGCWAWRGAMRGEEEEAVRSQRRARQLQELAVRQRGPRPGLPVASEVSSYCYRELADDGAPDCGVQQ